MKVFSKNIRVSLSGLIFAILVLILIVSIILYLRIGNSNSIWGTVIGSLAAGMIVAIIQFIIAWNDYKQTEKYKELRLIEVLLNRAKRNKYEDFIKNTSRNLDIMGVTACRFFNDFADTSKGAPDNATVLLQALDRGVQVRVLLPANEYLPASKRTDSEKVKNKYEELSHRYNNISIKYFEHSAAHSIFRIDDTCIIGPVFPELESRNTPALHVMKSSPIALKYMDYFESEWKKAKNSQDA